MKKKIFILLSTIISMNTFADPSPSKKWEQKNSKCTVITDGGEYPMFTVYKDKKNIFKPKSDGVSGVSFSNDGGFVAIGSSEVNKIDVRGKYYNIAIINCESDKISGYNVAIKGVTAAWPKKWRISDKELELGAYFSNVPGERTLMLDFHKLKLP